MEHENLNTPQNAPLQQTAVMCCAFLDWVNLHTHFWKSPHMKLWYDKSKFYGEKGFTTMELYELFVAQHSTTYHFMDWVDGKHVDEMIKAVNREAAIDQMKIKYPNHDFAYVCELS